VYTLSCCFVLQNGFCAPEFFGFTEAPVELASSDPDCQVVNLLRNPERFTGYAGSAAHRVWGMLHEANCFSEQPDGPCLEQRFFHRVLSGMHASVTVHLCQHWLVDPIFGEFAPNPVEFEARFADHPEWLDNLHFAFGVLLRAVVKALPLWSTYPLAPEETTDPLVDSAVRTRVLDMLRAVRDSTPFFNEGLLFAGSGDELRREFRENMLAVTRAINCVGCERCRLWGKLQVCAYLRVFDVTTPEPFVC
jgi:ERO1-like protein alpha